MLIARTHYKNDEATNIIHQNLANIIEQDKLLPLFICIGSDRHLLDCFGPLIGTMLNKKLPHLLVHGTLDDAIHAKNLTSKLKEISANHKNTLIIAIDASVGDEETLGYINMRQGGLQPGKALAKKLPMVGDYSITGIVSSKNLKTINSGSLADVYHMAELVYNAIEKWDNSTRGK